MGRKKKKKDKRPDKILGSNDRNARPKPALDEMVAAVGVGDVEAVRVLATELRWFNPGVVSCKVGCFCESGVHIPGWYIECFFRLRVVWFCRVV